MKSVQILALILTVIIVLNFVLFAFGLVNPLAFWVIIIIIGITAYKVIPKIKK